ncbi:hypothetical protein [Variovorax saccharolyticus]|uniref:hypothetical protein n=1 Tax=Variovorax saccharolyticus TaxID=3053516 RepID=UPI0025766D44|nr:hypothetical protein [Variovorax sp. J31P216]MDM0029101.1 hypothetical protein [Variovorax sp. J31P216]
MSDYLSRFQAQTRRKADPELVRRWEWDARYHGDKNIKNQASNAKRTATSMQKACEQFSNLKPEHELAIKAAASALRSLAEELALLAAWAKDYHAFCAAEWKKQETQELESLAQQRWGQNDQALKFECDLIAELGTTEGQRTFAHWCHGAGRYEDCKIEEISCRVDCLLPGPTDRIRAAITVRQGNDRAMANKWEGRNGPTVICSWADYEAYLAYRKEVARASARIVAMAGRQTDA